MAGKWPATLQLRRFAATTITTDYYGVIAEHAHIRRRRHVTAEKQRFRFCCCHFFFFFFSFVIFFLCFRHIFRYATLRFRHFACFSPQGHVDHTVRAAAAFR